MKSILYVGATLMIGASIYGFVDYKKTSQEKEFTGMYAEEKSKEPVAVPAVEKTETAVSNNSVARKKASVSKKSAIKKEEVPVISSVRPIAEDEKMNTGESKRIDPSITSVTPSKEHSVYKTKKKKKLNTKIFSRAPLREEMEVEKVLVVPAKTEVKKDETKKQ